MFRHINKMLEIKPTNNKEGGEHGVDYQDSNANANAVDNANDNDTVRSIPSSLGWSFFLPFAKEVFFSVTRRSRTDNLTD